MAVFGQSASQPVRALRRPAVGWPIGGLIHDPGHGLRRGMHHGQLHRATRVFHNHDVNHAQLRNVLELLTGRADAGVRRGLRGGVHIVHRPDIRRVPDTGEPALAVRAGPPRRRGVLAESVAHRAAHSADVPGENTGGERGPPAVQHSGPAVRGGRVQADGHNDDVPVLAAVQRVVRVDRVPDTDPEQPARDGQQLPDHDAGRVHQSQRHDSVVGATDEIGLQTTVIHIVLGLYGVHGTVGRFLVLGRHRQRVSHQRGRDRVHIAEHGHERTGSEADTIRHARRDISVRRRWSGWFDCRLSVVHIQFYRN